MDIRSKMLMDVPLDGVPQESGQGNRLTGKLLVAESRGPRAGRDRESVRVRVVGDGAFGWAEAANAWGATVEVVVHIIANIHTVSELFDLPKSCGCVTAARRFCKGGFDGLFLSTIRTVEDAGVVGKLFNIWQPRVAILALLSSLTRSQSGKYLTYLDHRQYVVSRCMLSHEAMGGVTRSRWHFLRETKRVTGVSPEKIMTEEGYARTLQTVLDDTVGK